MRISKLGLIAALAVGGLLVCTNLSSAQEAKEGKKKGMGSPQQMVEQMDKELKLTADQKTKVTTLFEERSKKIRELRSDTSLSQEERREKSRALMQENDKKLKAILTSEQWEKWQKTREQYRGGKKGEGKRGEGKKTS